MEKFSNTREDYWNKIKNELLDTNDSEECRFQYLEIGQLLSHGFSVTLNEVNPSELELKIWNAEYDNKRFDKGVFNLDRLAIVSKKVKLNSQESETISRLIDTELELTNWGGIVLDGLFCQFEINGRKLDWNTNKQINSHLSELVELIRIKAAY